MRNVAKANNLLKRIIYIPIAIKKPKMLPIKQCCLLKEKNTTNMNRKCENKTLCHRKYRKIPREIV